MESSATGRCIPHKSKKRVFPGNSSCMESESSPPGKGTLKGKDKMLKKNEDAMVMISSGTNSAVQQYLMDGVCSSKEAKSRKKGKGIISSTPSDVMQLDSDDGVSDSYNGKDYLDSYADDYVFEDEDEYEILQSHFDNIDLPTGIEASIPPFQDPKNKMASAMQYIASMASPNLDTASRKRKVEPLSLSSSAEPAKATKRSVGSTSFTGLGQQDAMKVRPGKKPLKARRQKHGQVGAPEHEQVIPMEDGALDQDSGSFQISLNAVGSSSRMGQLGDDDVPRNHWNFKKFDIVEDHSDHHYSGLYAAETQPARNWAKKIQEEWRLLKNLPDTIFVRVYESRMDLLSAVIMGAEGTPYHDGLFFFDVHFPSNYPYAPPKVYYRSGGLRINPNLYKDGTVCLSLLNTWIGVNNEMWIPGTSSILQVLVSIQGLILNAKPYFNEPALAASSGTSYGESRSMQYNENTLVLSLKTMVYNMKNPPKHFEDLVIGHFRDRAHGILTTCKAHYTNSEETASRRFRSDVEGYMKVLVGAFKEIGVQDVDEFLPPTRNLTQKIRAFFGI